MGGRSRPPATLDSRSRSRDRTRRPSRARVNRSRATTRRAASLDDIHEALRALDGSYGRAPSTSLLPAASQHLGQIATIRGTRRASSVRRELDAREADAAMLMGQLVWDASQRRDHDTARMYFDQAISAARRAGDPVVTAHGLLRNGYIALYGENDPLTGLTLAQAAAETATGSSHTLAGLGLLHVAEAHAMLGHRHDCEHTLADADAELGRFDQRDGAAHLSAEPEFDRLAGACYLSLGKHTEAAALPADTAARLRERQKSRAIVLGNLALAHVRQGERGFEPTQR